MSFQCCRCPCDLARLFVPHWAISVAISEVVTTCALGRLPAVVVEIRSSQVPVRQLHRDSDAVLIIVGSSVLKAYPSMRQVAKDILHPVHLLLSAALSPRTSISASCSHMSQQRRTAPFMSHHRRATTRSSRSSPVDWTPVSFQRIINNLLVLSIPHGAFVLVLLRDKPYTSTRSSHLFPEQLLTRPRSFLPPLFHLLNQILEIHFRSHSLRVRQRSPIVIVFRQRVRASSE